MMNYWQFVKDFRGFTFRLIKLECEKMELLSNIQLEEKNDSFYILFNKSVNDKTASCDITDLLNMSLSALFNAVYDCCEDDYMMYLLSEIHIIIQYIKNHIIEVNKTYKDFMNGKIDKLSILKNLTCEIIDKDSDSNLHGRPYILHKEKVTIYKIELDVEGILLLNIDIDNEMMEEYHIILDELFVNTINDSIQVFGE